jgi:hypothetical protein
MNPPAVIKLPLSTFENMTMELAWRIDEIHEHFRDFHTEMYRLKALFTNFDFSTPLDAFDPFQTIGKYC